MRVFITVLVLIFSLQSRTKADDISDFQIEGMSIGDSLLDYFSESEIKSNKQNYYKSKKFTPVEFNLSYFNTYKDGLQFHFKTADQKYKIHNISGIIYFKNGIENCYRKS